ASADRVVLRPQIRARPEQSAGARGPRGEGLMGMGDLRARGRRTGRALAAVRSARRIEFLEVPTFAAGTRIYARPGSDLAAMLKDDSQQGVFQFRIRELFAELGEIGNGVRAHFR